jgi:hypothetical protein
MNSDFLIKNYNEINKQYANKQNTIYDHNNNNILYGINSNMHVSGVSDGTCKQLNPLIFTSKYICGAGVAGGSYNIDNKKSFEKFDTLTNCNGCNITEFIIFLLIIFLLIGLIYSKKKFKLILYI